MVGVLVLVDADVAEALLVLLQHLGARTQQLERADEQVVEVHGVRGAQAALELQVHLARLLLLRGACLLDELLRADHAFFAVEILERIMLMGYCFCSMPSCVMISRTMRRESSSS